MPLSYDNEAYEQLKKYVINQKKNKKLEPIDLYKLASLLPRWKPNDKLPVCLLCRDSSKQPSGLGHIIPHSVLKEAGLDKFLDYNRGAEAGISRMGYYAFCGDCESKFQQGEVSFNPEFFKKLVKNPKEKIEVKATKLLNDKNFPWLYYTLISIFWRSLCFTPECDQHIKVLECLREYLLDWEASSETLNKKVKLFLFAPNSEIEDKLAKVSEVYSRYFYKMFHSSFHKDPSQTEPDALQGWLYCGPLHVAMIYSEEDFKAVKHHLSADLVKWEENSLLTTESQTFTIEAHSSRYFPVSLYDQIVKWGSSIMSSTTRLPSAGKDSTSSSPVVEATHLHLLPKDVSYDATNDQFGFSSVIFKERTVIKTGPFTFERVKRGSEKILFVAIKGALKNGGEVAIGLNVDPGGTVSYMKGVHIPQAVSADLKEIPFKEQIEKFIKMFDV